MTMSGPSGGGGITKDEVLQLLFNISGGSTDNGIGINYIAAIENGSTAAGKVN